MIQKQHIVARAALLRVLVHGLFFDAFLYIPPGGQSYVKLSTQVGWACFGTLSTQWDGR